MSIQMAGLVCGPGKEFTIYFNPDQLESKRKKYGQYFKPLGKVVMQPAAPTRIKPTLGKNEYGSEVNKKIKQAKAAKQVGPAKVEKPVKVETPKREYMTPNAHNTKAVVCLTNGLFYATVRLAARAVGATEGNVSRLLRSSATKGPRGIRRKTAGHEFRLATAEEIKAQKAIIKPAKKYVSTSQYAPGKHPNSQQKSSVPVVNITMGTYHVSAVAAAKAVNGSDSRVCHAIKAVRKSGNPIKHKNCHFRHATPEEIKVQKMLP